MRVYSRDSNPAVVAAVHSAFESWAKRQFGSKYQISTPLKVRPQEAAPAGRMAAAAAAAAAAVAAAAAAGGGTVGSKRARELQFSRGGSGRGAEGGELDETSPSNLLRTKQRRGLEEGRGQ